jgi:hypothetical protein
MDEQDNKLTTIENVNGNSAWKAVWTGFKENNACVQQYEGVLGSVLCHKTQQTAGTSGGGQEGIERISYLGPTQYSTVAKKYAAA